MFRVAIFAPHIMVRAINDVKLRKHLLRFDPNSKEINRDLKLPVFGFPQIVTQKVFRVDQSGFVMAQISIPILFLMSKFL